ncbi:MAG TPA: SsrA-binding protein SmpB [Candidatus Dormibacteraeota bacterium]|nr:SsrA-binding protein SmpB [Candidatus Dormibacteraeota bacterium]
MPEEKEARLLARNRRARHEYHILEQVEAGIELWGTEVRSLRQGGAQITEAYVRIERGQAWLYGAHIQPYEFGNRQNHDPSRSRRLLLHRRQIDHLAGAVKQPGVTLVPLDMHLHRNRVKVELALGRGKREYDKRYALAEREARRQMERGVRRDWKGAV